MSVNLKRFSSDEIVFDKHEAWTIYRFFWPDLRIEQSEITDEDVHFAQALMLEAIDGSYKMGYVHALFDAFFMKVPASFTHVEKMIKKFIRAAAKHWFKHQGQKSYSDAKIYETVRISLARNFRSVIGVRMQTGELIY